MWKLVVLVNFCGTFVRGFTNDNNFSGEVTETLQKVVDKYDKHLSDISNAECVESIRMFLMNLHDPVGDDIWAIRMIDASGKIPSGVLQLNWAWVGSYDGCLKISSPLTKIKGKYCLTTFSSATDTNLNEAHLISKKMQQYYKASFNNNHSEEVQPAFMPSYGMCVPDKCTDVDVQQIVSDIIPLITWNVTCQTEESINAPLSIGAIATLSYFGVFMLLMILSTLYDVYLSAKREPNQLLTAFSVYSNGRKLFRTSKQPGDFSSVHGIRFLSMMWVIFGHTFLTTFFGRPLSNWIDTLKFLGKNESLIIGNAPYSVDTFFVVTGMLVVYSFMKGARQGKRFNPLTFYLHRYIRLTPPLIPVLLTSIYLIPYLSSGPFYPQLDAILARPCRNSWWTTLLYVQNYVNQDQCIAQTWYLNVDWQMYLISPLFLLFLPKYPKIGLVIMLFALTSSMGFDYFITWYKELPATISNVFGNLLKFNKYFYFTTHTRAPTWLIGGILGYILAKLKLENNTLNLKMSKWFVGIGWLIALTAIPTCVFAGYDTLVSYEYHPYSNAFYNTFARPAWALCICWIIFACSVGYGGIINTWLSLPVFQILNRFSYSVFLLHMLLLYIVSYSQKQPGYFSMFNVVAEEEPQTTKEQP